MKRRCFKGREEIKMEEKKLKKSHYRLEKGSSSIVVTMKGIIIYADKINISQLRGM